MMFFTILCISATASSIYSFPQNQGVTLNSHQVRYLQNKGFGPTRPTVPFRPTAAYVEEEEEYEDSEPESSQDRQPTYANYPIPVRTTLPKAYPSASPKNYAVPSKHQPQYRKGEQSNKLEDEEKEEEEEPDRLSLLLPQSKFNCQAKNTGYYADEELGCEVFHYCQENAKHSWICPEGFTFHQVHLICMPPGGDNICEKSADYHFVNEYLYKPVNLDEYQHKPNVTLRYSDRFFPNSYRSKNDDGEAPQRHHQHSVRVTNQPQFRASVTQPRYSPTTLRPQVAIGQVYRNPEEINISLQQRRPQQYTTAGYDDDYRK